MNTATATATPTTEQRVIKVVADQFGCPVDKITAATDIKEFDSDSLDQIEILIGIESEFDIDINDADAEGVTTVQGLIDLVAKAGA